MSAQPQSVTVTAEGGEQYLRVNMGPQHPSTHGVLRLELDLDGEIVRRCKPIIGYLHTGMEKTCETLKYVQCVTVTDRMDYLNPLGNNLAFSLAVEKLLQCEIPERAQILRVLLAELTRLNSHLVSIGSGAIDLGVTSVFLYCLREREAILDLFEQLTGQRMMCSFIRPGGLAGDADDDWLKKCRVFVDSMPGHIDEYEDCVTDNPFFKERTIGVGMLKATEAILDLFEQLTGQRMMCSFIRPGGLAGDADDDWLKKCRVFVDSMPGHIDEYEDCVTDNPFFKERTIGVGMLKANEAIRWGVSGPLLRAAGVAHDIRKAHPYSGYEKYEFKVVTDPSGDSYGRYKVRVGEMRESVRICDQALRMLQEVRGPVKTKDRKVMPPPREELGQSMEAVIHHFKLWTEGMKPPKGQAWSSVESPRGELGFMVASDGSGKPLRLRARTPSFCNLQAIEHMAVGGLIADLVVVIASIDPVMGDVDR